MLHLQINTDNVLSMHVNRLRLVTNRLDVKNASVQCCVLRLIVFSCCFFFFIFLIVFSFLLS